MRALIACAPANLSERWQESGRVRVLPHLSNRDDLLVEALREHQPDALVVDRLPSSSVLRHWRGQISTDAVVLVRIVRQVESPGRPPDLPTMDPISPTAATVNGIPVLTVPARPDGLLRALAVAERYLLEQMLHVEPGSIDASTPTRQGRPHPSAGPPRHTVRASGVGEDVLVVGAGVVGLVAAWHLGRSGYRVTVIDGGPDPRAGASWTRYGCTWGGDNARMFTLTEADDYHDHVPGVWTARRVFDAPPTRHGWDVRRDHRASDDVWVQEFRRVPPWLATGFNHDTFGLNRRSGELWDAWRESDPEIFEDVQLRQDVLRLYEDPAHFEEALARQNHVGATLAHYDAVQLRRRFPALADAEAGAFAGGVLVRGFTVNVHDFLRRLLEDLEISGANLRFGVRATTLQRADDGTVTGVQTAEGPRTSRHYVISPGAYGNELLTGTLSDGQIHGVLGCWATIPDLEPFLENSLKVAHRGHIVEDANVTVTRDGEGRPILIVGSGYGWTGADPTNIDQSELDAMHRGVADTIRRLFPRRL